MNTGQQAVEWLCKNQLQVDAKWSVRDKTCFTWWADRQAQTIRWENAPGIHGWVIPTKLLFALRCLPVSSQTRNHSRCSTSAWRTPPWPELSTMKPKAPWI